MIIKCDYLIFIKKKKITEDDISAIIFPVDSTNKLSAFYSSGNAVAVKLKPFDSKNPLQLKIEKVI